MRRRSKAPDPKETARPQGKTTPEGPNPERAHPEGARGKNGPWFPVQNEEFPEGPYGTPLYPDDPPGKTTPWTPGERAASAHQDENPAFSDGPVPPPGSEPPGKEND